MDHLRRMEITLPAFLHGLYHFLNQLGALLQSGNEWQLDDNGKPSPYDVRIVKVQPGDMILLCSDGVHGVLGDEPIVDAFCLSVIAGAAAIPPALVDNALNAGSSDNCTVVLGVVES
jgi:serine/threonine protein phosphatase PrpC